MISYLVAWAMPHPDDDLTCHPEVQGARGIETTELIRTTFVRNKAPMSRWKRGHKGSGRERGGKATREEGGGGAGARRGRTKPRTRTQNNRGQESKEKAATELVRAAFARNECARESKERKTGGQQAGKQREGRGGEGGGGAGARRKEDKSEIRSIVVSIMHIKWHYRLHYYTHMLVGRSQARGTKRTRDIRGRRADQQTARRHRADPARAKARLATKLGALQNTFSRNTSAHRRHDARRTVHGRRL